MLMEVSSRVIGKTTKLMAKDILNMLMEVSTKENGLMICNTAMELKCGLMELNIKVTTRMEERMVQVI